MIDDAKPAGAHGPWRPIAALPAELMDGRYVLLWVRDRPLVAFWAQYDDGGDWSTDNGLRPTPTVFTELVDPTGVGPIYDAWQDG